MDMISVAGLGIISAVLCLVVRQYKPELSVGISIACGVLVFGAVITLLAPSVEAIRELSEAAGLSSGYAQILLKALAVCYITQLSADCCRDSGESAIAGRIELAGKAAIVAVSLPVFTELAELVTGLVSV